MGRSTMLLGVLMLSGCGGGELADETLRRSAEQALDTSSTPGDPPIDSAFRLPVFADSVPSAVGTDSTAAPPESPQWTVGVAERPLAGANRVSTLRDVRVGRNAGFDRVVLDFGSDPVPGYRVEYGVRPVRSCGSGEAVDLEGAAALVVQLRMTQAHDEQGRVTVARPEVRPDMPVIRHVKLTCDFEAEVVIAIGATGSVPYRVMVEESPNRLIVDLQQ